MLYHPIKLMRRISCVRKDVASMVILHGKDIAANVGKKLKLHKKENHLKSYIQLLMR